ncbi:MAG: DNA polymerase III subunit chi [Nevskiaceae bacterium]
MTRVDFYVLPDASDEGPLATACRLCEKAAGAGKRVHVHAPDDDLAREFDRLLWVYKQGGFVAHERVGASDDPAPAPVLIGGGEPPLSHRDVLVNLGAEVPAFYERFERVLEIVAGDAAMRNQSRARFKFYRDRGITPESHNL